MLNSTTGKQRPIVFSWVLDNICTLSSPPYPKKNTEERTLLKDSMPSFLAGYRIGITPGQAMFCFFLLTTAVAICVTLLCCHVSGTDPLTTYKYIVTRLKFYYYYYLRRAPSGNKYFWYRSSMEVSCLNNCNWSEKKRSSYKLVYGTCYRRVQIPL